LKKQNKNSVALFKAEPRKGARSMATIPGDILKQLNAGEIPTANLVEWLAIDVMKLLQTVAKKEGANDLFTFVKKQLENEKTMGVNQLHASIGKTFFQWSQTNENSNQVFTAFSKHKADIVRGWCAYFVAANKNQSLKQLLDGIKPFANDNHFGVREIAWMAARPQIANDVVNAIKILQPWSKSSSTNIRRFASEVTRPRGVWCKHIELLKEKPFLASTLLSSLNADKEKYVKDSVGNWLNDASKTQPHWVVELCDEWKRERKNNPDTLYIINKGLRSIK
jgi:3-methyladenine DNA glycosylase AlkC